MLRRPQHNKVLFSASPESKYFYLEHDTKKAMTIEWINIILDQIIQLIWS